MKLWPLFVVACVSSAGNVAGAQQATSCAVTQPNRTSTVEPADGNYGNDDLVTALWPDGKIVFKPRGPGFVLPDGALAMKFPWWRLRPGRLTIDGRRLYAAAPPLRACIPDGYRSAFQATSLVFPTPGCWEVTGRVAGASLTFVVLVDKIGDGPGNPRDQDSRAAEIQDCAAPIGESGSAALAVSSLRREARHAQHVALMRTRDVGRLEGTDGTRARQLYRRFEEVIAACGEYHIAPAKTRIAVLARMRFAGITALSEAGMTCSFALPHTGVLKS